MQENTAKAGVFLLACVAGWHGFLCWMTLTCPRVGYLWTAGMPDAWHVTGFGFSLETKPHVSFMLWEKRFKSIGQDETNPRAVSIVTMSSPGVLSSLNMFARPGGLLYVWNVPLHWDACFFGAELLCKLMSPFQIACMKCKYFLSQCCLNSANSEHLTWWSKTDSLFLFPRFAHAMNFTCAISWMLLVKM